MRAAASTPRAGSSSTSAVSAASSTLEDIGNVVLAVKNGTPVLVHDVGDVVIGHAPRLGQFGFNQQNDAVEGVVLMRTGEQAQTVLKGVEAKTRSSTTNVLPKDVKVVPFYDRRDLDRAHDAHGGGQPRARDRARRSSS